jgi:hypothetical protein
MPDWLLLLPIFFPLIGALFLFSLSSHLTAQLRRWLALGYLAIEIALVLLNIAPGTHRLAISNWELASLTIALQMDGVTQLLLLTMFVPLTALWLVAPPRQPFDLFPILALTASLLLAAADGFVAALLAWILLDLALFVWRLAHDIERATALQSLAIGLCAGTLYFAGASLLTPRPADGALLIGVALWARLGLFPFHSLLPTRGADELELWFARGIPTIAAANLWLHWSAFHIAAPYALVGVLTSVTLIVAAIWIWRATDVAQAVGIGAASALAFVPLAIAYGGDAGIAFALWQVLAIAFATALCEIALRWSAGNRSEYARVAWFLGLLALAGLPLTPAFLGRIGLYVALTESGEWLFLLLAGAATLIVLARLWGLGLALRGNELRDPTRAEYVGLGLIAFAFAALAFTPMLLAPALDISESAERALDRVIRTNNALGVAIGAVVLILPIIGAYFSRVLARDYHPGAHSVIARLARVGDLEWLEREVSRVGFQIGAITRGAFTLTEENPTVWILFISLWVAIFIAIAR